MSKPTSSSAQAPKSAQFAKSAPASKSTTKSVKSASSAQTHGTQLRETYYTYHRLARRTFAAFVVVIIVLALAACAIALAALFQADPDARTRAVTHLVLLVVSLAIILTVFYLFAQHLVNRCLSTLDYAINLYRRVANDAAAARRNLDQPGTSTGPRLDCALENWRLLGEPDREQFLMHLYGLERDDLYALLARGGWQLQTMSEQDCLKLGHFLWDY